MSGDNRGLQPANARLSPSMLLESLSAQSFRNLAGTAELAAGLNILTGENGQGKTNWLEAIAVLGSVGSFRTAKLVETIRFGEEQASVTGSVRESREIVRELRVAITPTTRAAYTNGKKDPIARYLGQLNVVVFNSDELEVVRGTPEARRRFLDEGIVSLHPPFVQVFADYGRVIRQKNSLLSQARDGEWPMEKTAEALQPWNEQLAKLATRIHRGRVRFVERLNEVLHKHLFGREELSIAYRSSLEGKGDLAAYEELIAERLKLRIQAELVSGHALIGPHRDDMELTFDGHDLRKFGSAGQ